MPIFVRKKCFFFLRILWMSHYQLEEMSNLQRWKQPYWLSFPRVSMWFPKGQQLWPMSILLTLTLMSSSRKGKKRSCYFNKLPTSLSTSISLTTFFAPSIKLHCKCLQEFLGTSPTVYPKRTTQILRATHFYDLLM